MRDMLTQDESNEHFAYVVFIEEDEQERAFALTHILVSVDSSFKAMVCGMRCSRRTWKTLERTFQSVSETSTDKMFRNYRHYCQRKVSTLVSTQAGSWGWYRNWKTLGMLCLR